MRLERIGVLLARFALDDAVILDGWAAHNVPRPDLGRVQDLLEGRLRHLLRGHRGRVVTVLRVTGFSSLDDDDGGEDRGGIEPTVASSFTLFTELSPDPERSGEIGGCGWG